MSRVQVEACVEGVESALAAVRGGADRLELCANLHDGGTTPSAGLMAAVRERVAVPVHVLVRPRGGGFVYTDAELDVMRHDIAAAIAAGADAIVSGILLGDGTIDADRTALLVEWSAPRPFVFHRAFDATPDLSRSLATLMACGARAVLTSGGAESALAGAPVLRQLVGEANGRLTVIAGGGVRTSNVARIVRESGVRDVHTRAATVRTGPRGARALALRRPFPNDQWSWEETDEGAMQEFVAALRP